MTRAAIYARFSSHKQHEESIETQVETCRRKADELGAEVVAVYADRAISGRGTERRTEFVRGRRRDRGRLRRSARIQAGPLRATATTSRSTAQSCGKRAWSS